MMLTFWLYQGSPRPGRYTAPGAPPSLYVAKEVDGDTTGNLNLHVSLHLTYSTLLTSLSAEKISGEGGAV
jgi:hypothetical protein